MLTPGLVSVTFRKLAVSEIIQLAAHNELPAIEWGGDIHVPHGNIHAARDAKKQTLDAGLQITAYGSYYTAGAETNVLHFTDILATAVELGAPAIRVWAGKTGSETTPAAIRTAIVQDLRSICTLADAAQVKIALEFHHGTLTDSDESALRLIHEVAHPNLYTLWQPRHGEDTERAVQSLKSVLPYLLNVHVFHWWPTAAHRLPLSQGADRWKRFISILKSDPYPHALELEFVRNDDVCELRPDAAVLHSIIKG